MTREIKLALILGSALVLVVGVLISDHLSGARNARIAQVEPEFLNPPAAAQLAVAAPEPRRNTFNLGPSTASGAEPLAVTPTGTLVDPSAPMTTSDPVAGLLPPTMEPSAQLSASEQDTALLEMAKQQEVPITYEPPAAPVELVMGVASNATPAPVGGGGSNGAREITVRDGDTLWSLAEAHLGSGAQFTRLLEANKDRIGSGGDIRVGTRLRLPSDGSAEAKPANAAAKSATKSEPPATARTSEKPAKTAPKTYTVKKGDTLGSIAASTLGTSKRWKDILDVNPGLKPSNLAIGAQIKLPPK